MYMPRCFFTIGLVLLFAFPTLPQQSPSAVERDPLALAALAQSYSALGGANVNGLSRTQMTLVAGGVRSQGSSDRAISTTFRVKVLGLDRIRWEFDERDGTQVIVSDRQYGWAKGSNETVTIPVHELAGFGLETMPLLAIWEWLSNEQIKVADAGPTPDGSARQISVRRVIASEADDEFRATYERMSQCDLFLDGKSFLPVRLRYYIHPGDQRRNIPVDVLFSDFKAVGGAVMPFTATRQINRQTIEILEFQSFSFGALVSDSDFSER